MRRNVCVGTAAAAFLTYAAVSKLRIVRSVGSSMEPTIPRDGALLLVARTSLQGRLFPFRRNTIVVFHQYRPNGTISACKRVCAVAKDTVYGGRLLVPESHVWVQGDHGQESRDSRLYGAVDTNLVWGRVIAKLWPRPFALYYC